MTKKRKNNYTNIFWMVAPALIFLTFAKYLFASEPQVPNYDKTQSLQTSEPARPVKTKYSWDGKALLTFWFDDAWETQYDPGYEILNNYGYKAALAVPTQLVGYPAYMNWYQVRKLQYLGWEITAHSRTHNCDLVGEDEQTYKYEILGSKEDLEKYGILTDIYVAPCGRETEMATAYIMKNFSYQRIVEPGLNDIPVKDKYSIKVKQIGHDIAAGEVKIWIDEAIRNKQWIILMLHQVDYENMKYGMTPEMLTEIAGYVKKTGINVVLPIQALSI